METETDREGKERSTDFRLFMHVYFYHFPEHNSLNII